jgi:hypothetical protein
MKHNRSWPHHSTSIAEDEARRCTAVVYEEARSITASSVHISRENCFQQRETLFAAPTSTAGSSDDRGL